MDNKTTRDEAVVVVLGDIGRSPRMCNHAISLATRLDYNVTIIGYLDSKPDEKLDSYSSIRYRSIPSPPGMLSTIGLPTVLVTLLKGIWLFAFLAFALIFRTSWRRLSLVLMQNPPAIPCNFLCWLNCRLKGAKFVIDWHNYMWTILTDKYNIPHDHLNLPGRSSECEGDSSGMKEKETAATSRTKAFVDKNLHHAPRKSKTEKKEKRSRFDMKTVIEWVHHLEGGVGAWADASLCVSRAMQQNLQKVWGIQSAVFYDRPPKWKFSHVSDDTKHNLLQRLADVPGGEVLEVDNAMQRNSLSTKHESSVDWNAERPLVLISSTSWTPDEDFNVLLEAVIKYNQVARLSRSEAPENRIPDLLLIITGKGPEKQYYIEKMSRLALERVKFFTPWLEAEDYPTMMSIADIGVSLHYSTSSLDLPMKVVDMLGSGLPVVSKRYACIGELVHEGRNGRLFDNSADLALIITQLATGFPNHCKELNKLRSTLEDEWLVSWEENWENHARPILEPTPDPHYDRIMATEPVEDLNEDSEEGEFAVID